MPKTKVGGMFFDSQCICCQRVLTKCSTSYLPACLASYIWTKMVGSCSVI